MKLVQVRLASLITTRPIPARGLALLGDRHIIELSARPDDARPLDRLDTVRPLD